MVVSTLTEQGLVSVPSGLRKNMKLRPGARLRWKQVSGDEFRVTVEPKKTRARKPLGAMAMIGYARVLFPDRPPRTTAEVMREIRGEWKE